MSKAQSPTPEDLYHQRLEEALALAETLPERLRQGEACDGIILHLAQLLQFTTPAADAISPPLPDSSRDLLRRILEIIRDSQETANLWIREVMPRLNLLANSQRMKWAYESCQGMS